MVGERPTRPNTTPGKSSIRHRREHPGRLPRICPRPRMARPPPRPGHGSGQLPLVGKSSIRNYPGSRRTPDHGRWWRCWWRSRRSSRNSHRPRAWNSRGHGHGNRRRHVCGTGRDQGKPGTGLQVGRHQDISRLVEHCPGSRHQDSTGSRGWRSHHGRR